MASSSSSSHRSTSLGLIRPRNNKKYEVFVSFRGEDTRDKFTSHLYSALSRQSIQTFIDDQLNRGDEISQSLVNAIEASAISVIIFSESYTSSRWCVDELVKILECKKEYAQIVIPVLYRVDPSDVRNQTGSFGDSFSKLEEFKEAAELEECFEGSSQPESELINEVVNHILKRLLDEVFRPSDNKNQLAGVESRVEEIESLLGVKSKDVYALGIWGIGGIGKTKIARAIFDKISSDFEGSCFLENVREESQRPRGLACLRQKLLSNLLKDKNNSEPKLFTLLIPRTARCFRESSCPTVALSSRSVATDGQQQTDGRAVADRWTLSKLAWSRAADRKLLEGEAVTCVAASIGELALAQRRWL
ncbi:hypothetical protein KPL70_008233 [Citrus sinensis]|nr:hypothetical protein KPL70_008233 [Citrus sinensis]